MSGAAAGLRSCSFGDGLQCICPTCSTRFLAAENKHILQSFLIPSVTPSVVRQCCLGPLLLRWGQTAAGTTRRTTAWYAKTVFGEIMWTLESEVHIARHGVNPEEVEEALYSRPRLVEPGRDGTRLVYCAPPPAVTCWWWWLRRPMVVTSSSRRET